MRTPRDFAFVIVLCVPLCGVASATDAVQPAIVAPPAQTAAASNDSVVPAAKPEAKPAAAAKDPVVCRKVKETGSRTASKEVCLTASQWEQQKKNSRDVMNSIPSHNVGNNAGD
jgi:hypothetical protein